MRKLNFKKAVVLVAIATVAITPNVKAQWANSGTTDTYFTRPGSLEIGNISSPTFPNKVYIEVGAGDGVQINQIVSGACSMFLQNAAGTGNAWSLNNESWGDLSFINGNTGNTPLFIDGTNDNVVIGGSNLSPNASLEVSEISGVPTTAIAIHGYADNGSTDNYGVYAWLGATGGTGNNIGVYGSLGGNGGAMNTGIYGDANGNSSNNGTVQDWAGYFLGDVGSSTNQYLASDRKLKNDIKPMQNALDKLMLLKPSSYNYNFKDFPAMSLPQSNQMGLIAQDLEVVFPNLIKEVKEHKLPTQEGQAERVIPAHKMVNYIGLIPVLIAAVQDQQQQIQDLKTQVAASQQQQAAPTALEYLNADFARGFYMEQNIPNPYSDETTIKYSLPQSINSAYLAVYDLSGKQLASYPVSKAESSLTMKANDLAAGIYLYSIVADNKVMGTKRMVVSGK